MVFLLGSVILLQTCQLSGEQGAERQARRGYSGERQPPSTEDFATAERPGSLVPQGGLCPQPHLKACLLHCSPSRCPSLNGSFLGFGGRRK